MYSNSLQRSYNLDNRQTGVAGMGSNEKAGFESQYNLPTPGPDSPSFSRKPYRFSTLCATVENPNPSHKDQHGSSSVPIYQTATFKGVGGEYDYTRSGNPTRTHLGM